MFQNGFRTCGFWLPMRPAGGCWPDAQDGGGACFDEARDVRCLSGHAQALFHLEVRAADLYTLAYPDLAAAKGGSAWREGPVIL